MGHKGVSKRKAPKPKSPPVSSEAGNGTVSSLTRVSESPVARLIGKGEALSVTKGGKKKVKGT
jgi:hypothetical protein